MWTPPRIIYVARLVVKGFSNRCAHNSPSKIIIQSFIVLAWKGEKGNHISHNKSTCVPRVIVQQYFSFPATSLGVKLLARHFKDKNHSSPPKHSVTLSPVVGKVVSIQKDQLYLA